jgi:hypothetical protein
MRPWILATLVTVLGGSVALADDPTPQRLFHIERNKNANIVCYDAMVLADGTLREKDPVDVYWLKLAEGGDRKGLKWIERRLAYGIKVIEHDGDRVVLDMRADVKRPVFVEAVGDTMRALMDIGGRRAVVERIYIFADESGAMPKVLYLELFGFDATSGDSLYEKFEP